MSRRGQAQRRTIVSEADPRLERAGPAQGAPGIATAHRAGSEIGTAVRFWKTVADNLFPIGDATMLSRGAAPDKTLLKKVNQRLMRAGLGSHSRVTAAIRNGQVTLSGSIQYEHQRRTILRAASGVDGVSQVVDKLTVQPANSHRR
jgi:hypothetical protein